MRQSFILSCVRPRHLLRALAGAALLAVPGAALAQQFVQETATRFPVPNPTEYTNQLTIGDLDNDSDLDIIFANGQGFGSAGAALKARVYINNGSGVFTDQTDARTGGLTGWYRGAELGDCDGDGDLDVVLAQDFNKQPQLLINNGSGFFANESVARLPGMTLSSSRGQFGDVDNDGDLDLFLTSGTTTKFGCGQYRLYRNDGTCHYADVTSGQFPIANVCENQDCLFGDIDNDFDIDIKTASTGTNNSRMYRNNGAGTFTLVTGVPNDEGCYSYDFGDIDGDGDLDLLGANGSATNSAEILLENDGTGAYTNVSSQISPNPSEDDNDSKFFDYDVDGDLDLLIGRLGGAGEKLYRNDGTGIFTQVTGQITVVNDSTLDIKVADVTGDGALDILTAQGESGNFENRIYVNHGLPDTIAPRIIKTEQVLSPGGGPFVIRTLILDHMTSDRNFIDHGIVLHYTVNGGATQTVPMRHSGGQVYRGQIPALASGAAVEYWVEATDYNDNTATGPTSSFVVGVPSPAGRVPFGGVSGQAFKIRKGPAGALIFSWGASCSVNDTDYEVYQGTIGNWTSHAPVFCTTGGAKSKNFVPIAGDLYYLIVPTNSVREGSYGTDGLGTQRPASATACLPQAYTSCF